MSKGWQTQRKRVEMGGEAAVQPPQSSGATAHASAAVGPRTATQMTSSTSLSSVRASDARASSESRVVMPNALNDSHHRDRAAAGGGHRNELNGGPAIPSHTSTSAVRAHHPSDGPHSGAFPSHQGSPAVRSTSLSSSSASSSSTSSPQMGRAGMSTQSPKADPKPKRVFKAMTKVCRELWLAYHDPTIHTSLFTPCPPSFSRARQPALAVLIACGCVGVSSLLLTCLRLSSPQHHQPITYSPV